MARAKNRPHLLVGCDDNDIERLCPELGFKRVLIVDNAFEALDILNTLSVGTIVLGSSIEGMTPAEFESHLAQQSWCQFQRLLYVDAISSASDVSNPA